LSKTAGCRGLAKLGRWDDRCKVEFEHTLMPYLMALLKDNKMEPDLALPLLRICNPSQTWSYDLSHLAQTIEKTTSSNREALIRETIIQFEENNPGILMEDIVNRMFEVSSRVLGDEDAATLRLDALRSKCKDIIEQRNEHMNYR